MAYVESGGLGGFDGGGWQMQDEKASLVDRVKAWQRKGIGHKESWYTYVGQLGSGDKDPNRHDVSTLADFLAKAEAGMIDVSATGGGFGGKGKGGGDAWGGGWGGGAGGGWGDDSWGGDGGGWDDFQMWFQKGMMAAKGTMMGKGDMGMGGMGGMGKGGMGCGGKSHPNMKPGDWICPTCGDLVFAKKSVCSMCNTSGGTGKGGCAGGGKPGDWVCTACQNVNFSAKTACNQCGQPRGDSKRMGMRPGDWICPACGDLVFASKSNCKMCGEAKPGASSAGFAPY